MDQEGFLPIGLIASFHRVQALTTNIALIVEVSIFFFLLRREISDSAAASKFMSVILINTGFEDHFLLANRLIQSENIYMVTCEMDIEFH